MVNQIVIIFPLTGERSTRSVPGLGLGGWTRHRPSGRFGGISRRSWLGTGWPMQIRGGDCVRSAWWLTMGAVRGGFAVVGDNGGGLRQELRMSILNEHLAIP
ncbi:hypothetical protein L484_001838 [Morus notabilis]|uniref:Uncharacterized protein n=1 Tax=Morus notabilis TaxID=981085 RepID=W9RRB9_9ROSA|nr:hypothetical protein L484_001838 [Morus notabilis]